jgi:hypothetical protein
LQQAEWDENLWIYNKGLKCEAVKWSMAEDSVQRRAVRNKEMPVDRLAASQADVLDRDSQHPIHSNSSRS